MKNAVRNLMNAIGWALFSLKYRLGLAKEGKDFITVEDMDGYTESDYEIITELGDI